MGVSESGRVAGKIAIVTGAARGIGAAIVQRLAEECASVLATDITFSAEPRAFGSVVQTHHDVTSVEQWHDMVEMAEDRFGPVSTLVNNAGVVRWNCPIRDMTEEEYRRVIDVNEVGVFLGMKAVLPSMERAGGGAIMNMSSSAGMIGYWGIAHYVASKFAVRGLSKAAAIEFGASNIRVNSIHPASILTDMNRDLPPPDGQPIPRYADTSELANLVLFLASDEARYCTGAEFIMDGGHLAGKTPDVTQMN